MRQPPHPACLKAFARSSQDIPSRTRAASQPDARFSICSPATNQHTLVFFLLSGGGSALVELPLDPGVTLEDMQALNRVLVTCGASIDEINAVRKHLSAVKGGRLAVAAGAAMKITLGVTDVPEGQESALASGPTLPDPTTVSDACGVVRRYNLLSKLPPSIRTQFEHPESIPETPKAGDPAFDPRRAAFQILLGRHDLFHSAHHASESAEFVTVCDNTTDNWPVEKAVDFLLAQLGSLKQANPGKSVAVIADGEVSSPVTGDGVGGRNLAFVLDCVKKIAGQQNCGAERGHRRRRWFQSRSGSRCGRRNFGARAIPGTRPSRLFPAQRFLHFLPHARRHNRNRPHGK